MGFKLTKHEHDFTTLNTDGQKAIIALRTLKTVIWCFVITAIFFIIVCLGGCWMDGYWKEKGLEHEDYNMLPDSEGYYKHPKQNLLDKTKELLK